MSGEHSREDVFLDFHLVIQVVPGVGRCLCFEGMDHCTHSDAFSFTNITF